MPVSPDDFATCADQLTSNGSDEISRRSAISRRYYYIFHKVREENDNHADSRFSYRGGDHQEAVDFLKRIGYNNLADGYHDIRVKRNEADYDISNSIGQFEYQMFLADLEDFEREARNKGIIS